MRFVFRSHNKLKRYFYIIKGLYYQAKRIEVEPIVEVHKEPSQFVDQLRMRPMDEQLIEEQLHDEQVIEGH